MTQRISVTAGVVALVALLAACQAHRPLDRDNNPPGPLGGVGTNWENPPGPAGGFGTSPN